MVAPQRIKHAMTTLKRLKKVKDSAQQRAKRAKRAKALILKRLEEVKGTVKVELPITIRHRHHIPAPVRDMFLRCRSELWKSFSSYIAAKDVVEEVSVPGDLCPTRLHRKSAEHSRKGFSALVDWAIWLDDLQFSLDGVLDLSDFGITHSGFLRGRAKLMRKLIRRTDATSKSGMSAIGTLIEVIFSGAAPPPDVAHLIGLLKNFTPDLKPLLRIHSSRANGKMKGVILKNLVDNLDAVDKENTTTYDDILKKLPLENWIHKAMTNVHLHRLLRFKSGVSTKTLEEKISAFLFNVVRYSPTCRDFVQFRRNGEAHLLKDYSLDAHGALEEALVVAAVAAAKKVPSFAAVVAQQQQPAGAPQKLPTGDEPEFKFFLQPDEAHVLAVTIAEVILTFTTSREVAKAAAVAAAVERLNHPHILTTAAQKKARIEGRKIGYKKLAEWKTSAPALLSQPMDKRKMFDEENISDMMELVDPNILHNLQKAMFDENLLDLTCHEFAAVCLRSEQ